MGSMVDAWCDCGFHCENILVDRGFVDCFLFPAFCQDCGEIKSVDLLVDPRRCPKCSGTAITPYGDPIKSPQVGTKDAGFQASLDDRAKALDRSNFLCPSCGHMTLRFSWNGVLWD